MIFLDEKNIEFINIVFPVSIKLTHLALAKFCLLKFSR